MSASASDATSPLFGRSIVVTAGGTREPIDPVRYLGNRSTGRMGNAIAMEAAARGAHVTLITTVAPPSDQRIVVVRVDTADEMRTAVRSALTDAAMLVMAAAVADYRVAAAATAKLKKTSSLTLHLVPTVDILRSLVDDPLRDGVLVIGFAAETNDVQDNAVTKLEDKRLDLIVVNDVSRPDIGMGSEENEVTVRDTHGVVAEISRRPKRLVAAALLDIAESRVGAIDAPARPRPRSDTAPTT